MLSKIDALTSQLRKLIIQPDDSLTIGNSEQNKLLIFNNFTSDELVQDFKVFCQLPPYLIRSCIFPRENVVIMDGALPFFDFWAIKTINYFNLRHFNYQDHDFSDNLNLLQSLLLLDLQRERIDIINRETPLGKVIEGASNKLLPCFIYPLLEASVRRACNGLITLDGTITNVNDFPAQLKPIYETKLKRDANTHISNLGHELMLLTQATKNPLKQTIEATLEEFANCLNSPKNAYKTIFDARNGILHGEKIGSKGAIAAKYIIFLICLSSISEEDYQKEFKRIQRHQLFFR
jgi:hypothetical protein